MSESTKGIESLSQENRVFEPPAEFSEQAYIKSFKEYEKLYAEAAKNPEEFWAKQAESLDWFQKWDKILEWEEPHAKWFVGGKLNISYNCIGLGIVLIVNSLMRSESMNTKNFKT